MTSLAVQGSRTASTRRSRRRPVGLAAAPAAGQVVGIAGAAVAAPGTNPVPDLPAGLDRELELVACAVLRQRPAAPAEQVSLLVAAVAADLAARHPVDGYFPVLVHTAVLSALPC